MNISSFQRGVFTWATLVVLCAPLSLGCQSTFAKPRTSADLAIKKLSLYVEAQSNGSTTHIRVSPMDEHGLISRGGTDNVFVAEEGGPEKPLVSVPGNEEIVQISSKATKFSIVLVRGTERFVSTMELPPPFSLVAYAQANDTTEVRWTPSSAGSEMLLVLESAAGRAEQKPMPEGDAPVASVTLSSQQIQRPQYIWNNRRPDGPVVIATRSGGRLNLHPAFAPIRSSVKLQQIRAVLITPPPPPAPAPALAPEL